MIQFKLHVKPEIFPVSWENFIKTHPKNSIALDGYVKGQTKFHQDEKGCFVNFNHHEEVDRLSTRATCAQVLLAIRQGLMDAFTKQKDLREINIFVNDCDQDVCLSIFLLKNHWMSEGVINPLLNKLVHIEDMMDTCSGAYPFPMDMPALREISWVFQPYTLFRQNGGVDKKNSEEFSIVIDNVEKRVWAYVTGQSQRLDYNSSYEIIGGGKSWKMVIEHGVEARTAMMKDGIHAFVSCRKRPDGNYTYSIGRISMYNPFPVLNLLNELNIYEASSLGCALDALGDIWGGSNTIAGSPRTKGSVLSPENIQNIINGFLNE